MQKQQYKKVNTLFWVGFLFGILFNILPVFSTQETFSSLIPLIPLFNILSIISIIVIIYALVLILKSKNRHWVWILLLIPLNVIGAVIIYMLKDKSLQGTSTPTYI
jgi:uncharacterized membrane protein